MSSLTISSTTVIVTPPERESPSAPTSTPTPTAMPIPTISSPADAVVRSPQPQRQPPQPSSRRPRWPGRNIGQSLLRPKVWSKSLKRMHVQQFFLFGVAVLELLSVIIIVVLNAAGQNSDNFDVSAPDMYLLTWTKDVLYETDNDNQTETFSVYWYLNHLCIRNGTGHLHPISRNLGIDFNWRQIDNQIIDYLHSTDHSPNSNSCGALPAHTPINSTVGGFNSTSGTSGSGTSASSGNATTTDCRLPTTVKVTDAPPQLSGQPAFGRVSFVFYILDIAITLLAWPLLLFLNGTKLWQKRGRIAMAFTKAFATTTNLIAVGLLISGVSWVVKHTSKDGASADSFLQPDNSSTLPTASDMYPLANNILISRAELNDTALANSTMPEISPGPAASSLVWVSVTSQVFACVCFITACLLLSQQHRTCGERLGSGRGRGSRPSMRQRPGSLPVYRPRDGNARHRGEDGEEYEDLPPYQREDPLGRPPSIPGYTISNGCTVTYTTAPTAADDIPLHRVASSDASGSSQTLTPGHADHSGRRSPSPDYEEVVGVEPISLLSNDGAVTQQHEPGAMLVVDTSQGISSGSSRRASHESVERHVSQDVASASINDLLLDVALSSSPTRSEDMEPTAGVVLTNNAASLAPAPAAVEMDR
ncbi:uncharacterized protein SPSK_02329 [Sporothrix schenckii 1099-18]|uniref:Uncharacterized protein n=1 Tax=Sporothrix schenckii 1099-18 TaxID=1397361 RepID=A0A0F2MF13_SPOSC|nr:uncharacterized protein SPSK_02329 [Sporothrix schenckii 1099-18]KJR86751.1 hypothetical protein SPSK_02329 [Sporothrix schenckii 1099-18]